MPNAVVSFCLPPIHPSGDAQTWLSRCSGHISGRAHYKLLAVASSGERTEVRGEGIYLLCCQPPLKCTQAETVRNSNSPGASRVHLSDVFRRPQNWIFTKKLSHTHTHLSALLYFQLPARQLYLEVNSNSVSPNEIPCLSPKPVPSQCSALFELLFPQMETLAFSLVHLSSSYPFHPPSKKPTSTSHPVPPQAPVLSVSVGQGSSLQVVSVIAHLLIGAPTLPSLPSTAPQEGAQHAFSRTRPCPGRPCAWNTFLCSLPELKYHLPGTIPTLPRAPIHSSPVPLAA